MKGGESEIFHIFSTYDFIFKDFPCCVNINKIDFIIFPYKIGKMLIKLYILG